VSVDDADDAERASRINAQLRVIDGVAIGEDEREALLGTGGQTEARRHAELRERPWRWVEGERSALAAFCPQDAGGCGIADIEAARTAKLHGPARRSRTDLCLFEGELKLPLRIWKIMRL